MYRALTLVCVLSCLIVGCASSQPAAAPDAVLVDAQPPFEDDAVAAALVFDPPAVIDEMPLDLSREGRERTAFVGFEEQTSSYIYIRTDDRQTGDFRDRYERRAIIEKVGAVHR